MTSAIGIQYIKWLGYKEELHECLIKLLNSNWYSMASNKFSQTTLDKFYPQLAQEDDQLNLIAHLIEPEEQTPGNDLWTRVIADA